MMHNMDREIKFRVWTGKEMKNVEVLDMENERAITWIDWYANEEDVEHYGKNERGKLMQYTGLKDKNGVEIYEGDVVDILIWETGARYRAFVEYWEGQCAFVLNEDGINDQAPLFNSNRWLIGEADVAEGGENHIEVIGNVWENPELVK